MNRSWILIIGWLFGASLCAQTWVARIPIGSQLDWVAANSLVTITPDGSKIAFMETFLNGSCSTPPTHRIALINGDGTGYRVLVDYETIQGLTGAPHYNRPIRLLLSGDGRTLAISIPHYVVSCNSAFPLHLFLLDVESGDIRDIETDSPSGITAPSFSDDGELLAYLSMAPSGGVTQYLARRDPVDPLVWHSEALIEPGELGGAFLGVLSGDGRSLIFSARPTALAAIPNAVYLMSLETRRMIKLTDEPYPATLYPSTSFDASWAAFSGDETPLWTVKGNGQDLKQVHPKVFQHKTTITRDGEWLYFVDGDPPSIAYNATYYRIRLDGSQFEKIVAAATGSGGSAPLGLPVSGDGSLLPYRIRSAPPTFYPTPLMLAVIGRPYLTTYGHPGLNSTLTLDVAGQHGSSWFLVASLARANIRMKNYGVLGLDPGRLLLLSAGVTDAENIGRTQVAIPGDSALVGIDFFFQALIIPPDGGGELTNVTTVTITDP